MSTRPALLVAQQLASTRSGVGLYVRLLIAELLRRGRPVVCATWSEEVDADGFPALDVLDLGPRARWDRTPGGFVALGMRVAQRLDESGLQPALVHFTDAREVFGYAARRGREDDVPVVGTVHDDYAAKAPQSPFGLVGRAADPFVRWAYYRWLRGIERKAYRGLARIMVNSRATGDSIVDRYRLPGERVRPVHLCVERAAARTKPPGPLRGEPAILFAGGNFYRKGLDTLVRAVAGMRNDAPEARLYVAGEDRSMGRVVRLAERLGVRGSVVFLGRLGRDDMAEAFAGVDVFAMPSRTEALGLVYLEAMRAGIPVVSGDVGGVTEIVRDGESGLTVPPEDPDALGAAILRVARDAELRDRLVAGGRKVLAERTPQRLADETLAVYDEVAAW